MPGLATELALDLARSVQARAAGSRAGEPDTRDAEALVRAALRCFEDARESWAGMEEMLQRGMSALLAGRFLSQSVKLFDLTIDAARRSAEVADEVTARTGRPVRGRSELDPIPDAVAPMRQSAVEALEFINARPPEVDPARLAEAERLFEQGEFVDLGESLARRRASKG
jgi:hypothetical protein